MYNDVDDDTNVLKSRPRIFREAEALVLIYQRCSITSLKYGEKNLNVQYLVYESLDYFAVQVQQMLHLYYARFYEKYIYMYVYVRQILECRTHLIFQQKHINSNNRFFKLNYYN